MQTFLPYPSFTETAKCLDYRRLGKQRVECKQLIIAINQGEKCLYNLDTGYFNYGTVIVNTSNSANYITKPTPWWNHPCRKMWNNYKGALIEYGIAICREWIKRGYKDSLLKWFEEQQESNIQYPIWIGAKQFNSAHRAALLFKNYNYYSKFKWIETPKQKYIWPV